MNKIMLFLIYLLMISSSLFGSKLIFHNDLETPIVLLVGESEFLVNSFCNVAIPKTIFFDTQKLEVFCLRKQPSKSCMIDAANMRCIFRVDFESILKGNYKVFKVCYKDKARNRVHFVVHIPISLPAVLRTKSQDPGT